MERTVTLKDVLILVLLLMVGFLLFTQHQQSATPYQKSYSNSSGYSSNYHPSTSRHYGSSYSTGTNGYQSHSSSKPATCYDGNFDNDGSTNCN